MLNIFQRFVCTILKHKEIQSDLNYNIHNFLFVYYIICLLYFIYLFVSVRLGIVILFSR